MHGLTIVFTNSITPKRSEVFWASPPHTQLFFFFFLINENIYMFREAAGVVQ